MQTSDCLGEVLLQPEPPPDPNQFVDPGVAAGWLIFMTTLVWIIFEIWALKSKHNTVSHLFQRIARSRVWFRWLFGGLLIFLFWHMIFGL